MEKIKEMLHWLNSVYLPENKRLQAELNGTQIFITVNSEDAYPFIGMYEAYQLFMKCIELDLTGCFDAKDNKVRFTIL